MTTTCQHTRTNEAHRGTTNLAVNIRTGETVEVCKAHAAYYTADQWNHAENGFVRGGTVQTTDRNGKHIAVTTCYEFEAGRWEGFVSIRDLEVA